MSKRAASEPRHTARTAAEKAERSDRLAAEMRRNLMKRKRQQREKTTPADDETTADTASDDAS